MFSGRSATRNPQEEIVLEWNNGKNQITEFKMEGIRVRHAMLVRFLAGLVTASVNKGGNPQGIGIIRDQKTGEIREPGISLNNSEEALVQRLLLADKAREMGLVVDNEAINHFLNQTTGGVLSRNEIQAIRSRELEDRLDENQLFMLLGEHLLAQKMQILIVSGARLTTPGVHWDYFNRMNRRIAASVMPLNVDDYIGEVEDPKESLVNQIYEEFKNIEPSPNSSDPGFKQPMQVALEYLVLDMKALQSKAKGEIGEKQVEEFYNENLDQFKRTQPPPKQTGETEPESESSEDDSFPPSKDADVNVEKTKPNEDLKPDNESQKSSTTAETKNSLVPKTDEQNPRKAIRRPPTPLVDDTNDTPSTDEIPADETTSPEELLCDSGH